MPSAAGFWDRIARSYARNPVSDEQTYRRKLKMTGDYLTPDMRLLEFGCGTGSTALVHAPQVEHIDAIDFSQRMIDIARDKQERLRLHNLAFSCDTLESLAPDADTYDVVLGHNVLHLMPDWHAALDAVYTTLKPGGLFFSSTACLTDFIAWFRLVMPLGRAVGLLPDLAFFTRTEFEQTVTAAGFEIETAWLPGDDRRKALFLIARKPGPVS